MSSPTRSIAPLLIRFGRLGDMLLQEPLLHLLRRRYGAPCTILTRGTWTGALYAAHPDVGEIRQLRSRHAPLAFSPERWHAIAALRRHDGPVYVSEDTGRSLTHIDWLLRLGRVRRERCVFANDLFRGNSEHWVDQLLRLGQCTPTAFEAAAYPWREEDLQAAPRLYLDARDRADAQAWMQQRGFTGGPLVLLQPGNWKMLKWVRRRAADPKFWPLERWVALLRVMRADLPKAHLLLCGSPPELPVLQAIQRQAHATRVEVAADDLPIRRLLAVMAGAHSMVSVDSGPAHMAAAVGCPLVTLYGHYSPMRWGRRSPCASPSIGLGGPPHTAMVSDLGASAVIDAWRSLGLDYVKAA